MQFGLSAFAPIVQWQYGGFVNRLSGFESWSGLNERGTNGSGDSHV